MKVKNIFPIFETDRLLLRELTFVDTQKIFELFSDPAVTKYYDFEPYTELEQAKEYIQRFSNGYINNEMIRWGIVLKETNTLIGTCGLHSWNQVALRAEIGFDLHSRSWGQGIMHEAIKKILEYGFLSLDLHRIEALIMVKNCNSASFLSKIGFSEEGTLREYGFWKNKHWDVRCFSLLKSEFEK